MARYLWTQKEDIGPSARVGHAMAYDSSRAHTILFGGDAMAGSFLNDTWEWNGEYWTQIADIGPDSRRDHALCFDSTNNVALLFGGSSATGLYGDTWSWNGEDWTQLEDSGPSARMGHAMVFDSMRGRAVLFGGQAASGLLNDTWEWDGNAWTQQEDTGPAPRRFHAMGFDLVHNKVVLFGGDPGNGNALGDTWTWDGSNWTQIANFGAAPCIRAAMVSTDVQIAMFGGVNTLNAAGSPSVYHETWVFDGKHWTHRQDIGPGPRWAHAMAFDTARRSIVLFGGLPVPSAAQGDGKVAGRLLGDTWEHVETDAAPAPAPAPTPAPAGDGGPNVAQLQLNPTTVRTGGTVTATLALDRVSNAPLVVQLAWVEKPIVDQSDANGTPIPDQAFHHIKQITVPADSLEATGTFNAPSAAAAQIVVFAASLSGMAATAPLTVT
jgi:hypothetical protein